jgi:hypothetical protein
MAFLGDRAAMSVGERVASVLGIGAAPRPDNRSLLQIDGITEDEAARLAEEGLATPHALAFASTLTLFLSTPFTLQQICDWQDQCLLLVRFTPVKVTLCREQLLWRGLTDAQRAAREFIAGRMSASEAEDITRILGLSGEAKQSAMLRSLAQDPIAERLDLYRRMSPYVGFVNPNDEKKNSKRMSA